MDAKTADPTLQLDVDLMTLDYLVEHALADVLHCFDSWPYAPLNEQSLLAIDLAVDQIKQNHPSISDQPNLEFRLHLLQFTVLFHSVHLPGPFVPPLRQLVQLRRANMARARRWNRKFSPPIDDTSYTASVPITTSALYKLDILPLFITAAAPVSQDDFDPSPQLFELLARYMFDSVIEIVANHSRLLAEPRAIRRLIREAFAWGCPVSPTSDDFQTGTTLFWDVKRKCERALWPAIKQPYIDKLESFFLDRTAISHDELGAFLMKLESEVAMLMRHMSTAIGPCVLTQISDGKLDGFSRDETAALKNRCGLT